LEAGRHRRQVLIGWHPHPAPRLAHHAHAHPQALRHPGDRRTLIAGIDPEMAQTREARGDSVHHVPRPVTIAHIGGMDHNVEQPARRNHE
jgi:hypothetical protein